jgi:hypothetical protein
MTKMRNPNLVENGKATQFQPGNKAGAGERAPISKRRARRIVEQSIIAEVAEKAKGKRKPDFTGDALDYLRAAYRGELTPDPLRMQAAATALRFEKPALSAVAAVASISTTTPADVDSRIRELLERGKVGALLAG